MFPLSVQKKSLTKDFTDNMPSVLKEKENVIGSLFQQEEICCPLQNLTNANALYGMPPFSTIIFHPSSLVNVYCPELQMSLVQLVAAPAAPPPAHTYGFAPPHPWLQKSLPSTYWPKLPSHPVLLAHWQVPPPPVRRRLVVSGAGVGAWS